MQCPTCGAKNPKQKKYCGGCGAKLIVVCSNCQCENPPLNKFCGDCGCDLSIPTTKVSQPPKVEPRPAVVTSDQERKHITVLFSDLSPAIQQ